MLIGVHPASTASCSNLASTSARRAWANTSYARGFRHRKTGECSWRITSKPWCRSTSLPCRRSGFRSCTCSWFWLTTEEGSCISTSPPIRRPSGLRSNSGRHFLLSRFLVTYSGHQDDQKLPLVSVEYLLRMRRLCIARLLFYCQQALHQLGSFDNLEGESGKTKTNSNPIHALRL